jgi:single-strand DNA-binding protein
MRDINTITLTGRLVHDPVLNRGASGGCLGHFVLASNRQCKDKNGVLQTETAFVPCKVFGGWAESAGQHKKGDQVVVMGRLRTEKWEKDGQPRTQLALVCDAVHFIPHHVEPPKPLELPEAVKQAVPF